MMEKAQCCCSATAKLQDYRVVLAKLSASSTVRTRPAADISVDLIELRCILRAARATLDRLLCAGEDQWREIHEDLNERFGAFDAMQSRLGPIHSRSSKSRLDVGPDVELDSAVGGREI